MAFCGFTDGAALFDATPIENLFLLEHLSTAPDKYLRVYLYARMLALHPELGGDIADMAKALHMDEEAVQSAFSYWEQQGLVRRLTDRPPTYAMLPVRGEAPVALSPMDGDYYKYRDFNSALQDLFDADKLLSPTEYRTANDWLNVYGLDQDAALRAVQYGISLSRSKSPSPGWLFKKMDKTVREWSENGVRTLEDVERAIADAQGVDRVARAVLKRLGMRRNPSLDELDCARRWLDEWHLSEEEILAACAQTTKARTPSFGYLDSILNAKRAGGDDLWQELADALRELDPGARPTPDLQKRYAELRAKGFEAGTIKLAAIQSHRRKKTRFEDVEWMLNRWQEMNLFTQAAAEAYVAETSRRVEKMRPLMERCGLERRPTADDLSAYERWTASYPMPLIEFAADCARGMGMPIRYMDKLLNEWAASGITDVSAARAQHESMRGSRPSGAGNAAVPANPALNYEQREYRPDDFGDDFFVDLDKYAEGGDHA